MNALRQQVQDRLYWRVWDFRIYAIAHGIPRALWGFLWGFR